MSIATEIQGWVGLGWVDYSFTLYFQLGYKVGHRLRELAPTGEREPGYTQPRAHLIDHFYIFLVGQVGGLCPCM